MPMRVDDEITRELIVAVVLGAIVVIAIIFGKVVFSDGN